ncbi:permease-like cell division protein FtsX [Catellatospora sichuanensis]|uniref:permease-like cell division protein FtsX n=1 Tax=Catellatospora sichuanensis TaxID=1969805 RepID=UPI001183B34B|nr:permease-like cell division protein FtsX [Catellatospora sichuanensis]
MSDHIDQPSVDSASPTAPTPVAEPPSARQRWLPLAAILGALLAGAVLATAAFMVLGRSEPEHRFNVSVYLDRDVTEEQRAAVRTALAALDPVNGVRHESREQAYRNFQELMKDSPDIVGSIKPGELPESFQVLFIATVFDCEMLTRVKPMEGVDTIVVQRRPRSDQPGVTVSCGNLL